MTLPQESPERLDVRVEPGPARCPPVPPASSRAPTMPTADAPGTGPPAEEAGARDDVADPDDERPLPQVLAVLGSIVAPTTLLTALLFYFGRLHVTGFFRYFGVNFTVLDLTVQDYLVRSADGLFVPLTFAAALGLSVIWTHRLVSSRLPAMVQHRVRAVLAVACTVAGTALLISAVAALVGRPLVLASQPEVGGLSLALGVVLLAYAAGLAPQLLSRSPGRPARRVPNAVAVAEWGALFVLVSVGLFWSVGSYAIGVGTGRAQQLEAELPSSRDAVLFSSESLRLEGPGIVEVRCADPDPGYRYRYTGLKLVLQSGDQYLFLPAQWSTERGAAVLIPRTEAIRLEFSRTGQTRTASC